MLALIVALCLSDICMARGQGLAGLGRLPIAPRVQMRPGSPAPSRPSASAEPWLRVYRFINSWGFRTSVIVILGGLLLAIVYSYARQHAPYPPGRSPLQRAGCLGLLAAVFGAPVLAAVGGAKVGVAWFTWVVLLSVIALALVNRVSRRCRICGAPLAYSRDVSARHPDLCIRCELVSQVQPQSRYTSARSAPAATASGVAAPSPPPFQPAAVSAGPSRTGADDLLSALLGVRSAEPGASAAAHPFPWQAPSATRATPDARVVTAGDPLIGKICPYCQTKIEEGDVALACPKCGMPHHAECWRENGGCTVYGCEYEPFG